jgi:hypothetical protein
MFWRKAYAYWLSYLPILVKNLLCLKLLLENKSSITSCKVPFRYKIISSQYYQILNESVMVSAVALTGS